MSQRDGGAKGRAQPQTPTVRSQRTGTFVGTGQQPPATPGARSTSNSFTGALFGAAAAPPAAPEKEAHTPKRGRKETITQVKGTAVLGESESTLFSGMQTKGKGLIPGVNPAFALQGDEDVVLEQPIGGVGNLPVAAGQSVFDFIARREGSSDRLDVPEPPPPVPA
eukprot:Hpha_TRINITY_DN35099_c0_g1::TRINITY_DN35099_c0_g1_i1::g.82744::m.82744